MSHLNSHIYSDTDNRHNHLDILCSVCKRGPLYFETIKVRTVPGNPVLDKKIVEKNLIY